MWNNILLRTIKGSPK